MELGSLEAGLMTPELEVGLTMELKALVLHVYSNTYIYVYTCVRSLCQF